MLLACLTAVTSAKRSCSPTRRAIGPHGVWLDRKLSTKVSPVFSKNLAQDWKASLHIDGSHSPYRKPSIDPATGRPERRVFLFQSATQDASAAMGYLPPCAS